MALSKKQRIFIDEYLKCWNATQAALNAGYSERSAHTIGWENLQKLAIANEIKRRLDESAMSADEVIQAIGDIGRADIDKLIDIDDKGRPSFNFLRAKEQGYLNLIKSITPTPNGLKVELHDRMKALELMGKHHALFTDKVEFDGDVTIKVKYEDGIADNSTETP
jgi:phage terminase small subunit